MRITHLISGLLRADTALYELQIQLYRLVQKSFNTTRNTSNTERQATRGTLYIGEEISSRFTTILGNNSTAWN